MSLHADAVRVLDGWQAPDARQEDLRRSYLDHLAAHADGLWRSCRPDHLTASALVIDPAAGRVLLMLHRRAGLWLQMGGHCEAGDASLAESARREAVEESGVGDLELLPTPARLDRHGAPCAADARHHLDVQYVALAAPGAREQCSSESLALRWAPYDELPEPTDDAVRRLVARARELVGC
jgi:8-oxo-dGTP pyrophosphatase MutT (NUDIX family)